MVALVIGVARMIGVRVIEIARVVGIALMIQIDRLSVEGHLAEAARVRVFSKPVKDTPPCHLNIEGGQAGESRKSNNFNRAGHCRFRYICMWSINRIYIQWDGAVCEQCPDGVGGCGVCLSTSP